MKFGILLAGLAAGAVTGLFGGGGGLILVPLLTLFTDISEESIFPSSLSVIAPVCLVALVITAVTGTIPWRAALPYLAGSVLGGVAAGVFGKKIPVKWLHRVLGLLILLGGFRYLWNG